MINLELKDPPVIPAVIGRHELPEGGMFYTIGADYVAETAYRLLQRHSILALDIETFGLGNNRFRIKTVTFADDQDAVILDPRDPYQENIIKKMINHLKGIIIHNSMYDVPSMYQRDLMESQSVDKVIDTIVTSRQANPGESFMNSHKLEDLTKKHFGINIEKKVGKDDFYAIDIHMIGFIHGAAYDALYTYRLLPVLMKGVRDRYSIPPPMKGLELDPAEKSYIINREQHVNHILLHRMKDGLCVDLDEVDKYEVNVRPQENKCELVMKQHGMTTVTNRNQLIAGLEREDAFPKGYKRTKGGAPSTKEEDLEMISHPLARAFAQHAKIQKVKQYLNTIADEAYRSGRVFPTTKILGAGTGRIAMSDPPLHQFTPDARSVIVAEDGDELSSIDWSQIEPTILVYCANDEYALNQYEHGEIKDFYEIVGNIVGIERKYAKTALLAQMYGQGLTSMAGRLGVSYDQAREYKNRIFAAMPEVDVFIKGMKRIGETRKVHTLFGRVLDVPMFEGNIKAYTAINYFIQGSAYDLLAEALMRINDAGLADYVYFTYHDELVVSTDASEEIAHIMRTPPERFVRLLDRVPILRAEPAYLGRHWGKV